ncbi:hypothetical protein ANCCAN_03819 [Ancylostoma caninum]|uniref:Uncharacterized protein n=1 Tax=Ancylostoma caninum TaxID=29170 RepID=A0A368H048_ANCCA|nr:hypothetical protein ANCCAN_03819 [Ancylostoma caninum]
MNLHCKCEKFQTKKEVGLIGVVSKEKGARKVLRGVVQEKLKMMKRKAWPLTAENPLKEAVNAKRLILAQEIR